MAGSEVRCTRCFHVPSVRVLSSVNILQCSEQRRFISPAVVSPETVDVELPRENSLVIRRGLMVVTKVIQNLANNIFFGKEAYMVVLNKFLKDNIDNVTRYLSELNVRVYLQYPSDDTDSLVRGSP